MENNRDLLEHQGQREQTFWERILQMRCTLDLDLKDKQSRKQAGRIKHCAKRTVKRPEGRAELPGFQSKNRAVGEEEIQIGIHSIMMKGRKWAAQTEAKIGYCLHKIKTDLQAGDWSQKT